MINRIILIAFIGFIFSGFSGSNWKAGKVDEKGNLIIAVLEDTEGFGGKNAEDKLVTVDMDWSILIFYGYDKKSKYCIFNNIKKQIFVSKSFNEFLNEIKEIPNETTIREIDKCTVSISALLPKEKREQLKTLVEEKKCKLEMKFMYCTCGKKTIYKL